MVSWLLQGLHAECDDIIVVIVAEEIELQQQQQHI
jgi:hypothetical protein